MCSLILIHVTKQFRTVASTHPYCMRIQLVVFSSTEESDAATTDLVESMQAFYRCQPVVWTSKTMLCCIKSSDSEHADGVFYDPDEQGVGVFHQKLYHTKPKKPQQPQQSEQSEQSQQSQQSQQPQQPQQPQQSQQFPLCGCQHAQQARQSHQSQ